MDGSFELNKPGWYSPQMVAKNDFLNQKLTSDQYGSWYSVKFQGDAETYLWQTKTEPIVDEKYWGWIEKTSSGKSVKFKWDKQNTPNSQANPASQPANNYQPKDNRDITLSMVWKVCAELQGIPKDITEFTAFFETVRAHVDELLLMSEQMKEKSARLLDSVSPENSSQDITDPWVAGADQWDHRGKF